jgi:predicted HTH transcriptional regulator
VNRKNYTASRAISWRYSYAATSSHQSERQQSDIANVGANVGTNEEKLLLLLKQDGTLTAKVLAGTLGITQRQVERMMARMKKEGVLVRHGASKNGCWEVVEKDSGQPGE